MRRARVTRQRLIRCVTLILMITVSGPAFADSALSTSLADGNLQVIFRGQYRARFEMNTGRDFFDTPQKNANWVSQRARFGIGLSYKERVSFFLQVQDVRRWGEELDTLNDFKAEGFDLHQAWGELRIVKQLKLRIGRQELKIDNERLIGAVDWAQQGRAFDGVRLYYDGDPWHAMLFYAKLAEDNSTQPNPFKRDKELGIAWFKYSGFPILEPSLLYVIDTDYAAKRKRHTLGTHLQGAWQGLEYVVEAYVQFGENADKSILAWMASLKAGYTLPRRLLKGNLGFDAWFTYLSGDRDTTDGKDKAFDTLFATNHKFYGLMDFFTSPANTGYRGLMDYGLTIRLQPVGGLKIAIDYHHFQVPRRISTGEIHLGDEIDLQISYAFWKYFKVSAVYGVLFPSSALKDLRAENGLRAQTTEHVFYLTTDFQF